jgi:O-antigen ligase
MLFYYGLAGLIVSLLSPEKMSAFYWGLVYLAPILVLRIVIFKEDPFDYLKEIIYLNYGVAILIGLILLPEVLQYGLFGGRRAQFYNLPFGLGEMRANGVGRFALILVILSGVRILYTVSRKRIIWFAVFLPGLFILAKTQSRTSLLGLAVASVLLVLIMGTRWQFMIVGPVSTYVLWISGYRWRAHQSFENLFGLTGREFTWQQALDMIKQSPFLGWGFHSDRILLESQHIHNSYIHAMIHSGIFGLILFTGAFLAVWRLILKFDLLRKVREIEGPEKTLLIEAILLIGFFSSRTFFESTAAFFGVDLLFLLPAMVLIYSWTIRWDQGSNEE